MKKAFKVARWEIKKTLTNKTFLISVLLTPLLFLAFALIPTILNQVESSRPFDLYVIDEIYLFDNFKNKLNSENINAIYSNLSFEKLSEDIKNNNRAGIIILNEASLNSSEFLIYLGGDGIPNTQAISMAVQKTYREYLLNNSNLNLDIQNLIVSGYNFKTQSLIVKEDDIFEKLIPGLFSAFILLGVFITGTMIFQSAIQEKKDKVSEIILSSISSQDLMSGKIFGFFIIGLFQILIWLLFAILILAITNNLSILTYLLNLKILLLLLYAFLGYLLYASIFISIGASIEDIGTSGNFQSIILMIPILPLFFIAAIITDPNGLIALIGTYFPLTTAGVMLFRLSISTQVPIYEIILTLFILIISVWLMMIIAGKIFKIGILKFGKNYSISDIFKWLKEKD